MLLLNNLLQKIRSYPRATLALAIGVGLGLLWLWQFTTYTPDNPDVLSRARRRQIRADIAAHQQALGHDTVQAQAAEAAAAAETDTARAHAARAHYYHQLAKPAAHAPLPATAATAEQLRRELTGHE